MNVVTQRPVSFSSISTSLRSRSSAPTTCLRTEAAVLEGIRWLIDQDRLTIANRLIVLRASFRWWP
jgi:hypothetical protein